jgi:hypothetical protein
MVEFRAQTQGANLQSSQVGKTKALVWDSTLTIHKVDLSNSTLINVRVVVTGLIDSTRATAAGLSRSSSSPKRRRLETRLSHAPAGALSLTEG